MWCLGYFISKVGVSHNIPPYFHLLLYKKITPPNPLTVEEPISFIWWGYPSIYYIITSFDMFQYFILFFLSVYLFLHLTTFVYIIYWFLYPLLFLLINYCVIITQTYNPYEMISFWIQKSHWNRIFVWFMYNPHCDWYTPSTSIHLPFQYISPHIDNKR